MLAYLLRRLVVSLTALLGLTVLAFFLVRLVPGDTVTALLGMNYSEAEAEAIREAYRLDEPLVVQYGIWLGSLVRGDMGISASGRPVSAELADALPVTLQLMAMSLLFAVALGVPLGVLAAVRRSGPVDYAASFAGLLGVSVPGFWLGTLLILVFALKLRWLPSGLYVPPGPEPDQLAANLRHMLLPSVALGAAVLGVIMRMTRASMVDVLGSDFVRTARAKGLHPRAVVFKHALRSGLIPVLTVVGIQAGYLLGGSVVIEEVFSLSGVGRLVLRAVGERDYPLLQAAILLIGTGFLTINLLVDVVVAWVDPRTAER